MSEHSPEPWKTDDHLPGWVLIEDANGREIVEQQGQYEDSGWTFSRKDARRIVAAVNALAGVPIEVLESDGFRQDIVYKYGHLQGETP